jgi:hypothetical protein
LLPPPPEVPPLPPEAFGAVGAGAGAGFGAGAGAGDTCVGDGGLAGVGEDACDDGVVTGAAGVVAGVTGAA